MQQLQLEEPFPARKEYLYGELCFLMNEIQIATQTPPARRRDVERLRSTVEATLRRFFRGLYLEVHVYGSQSNGLSDHESDVDLVILYFKT